MSGFDICKEIAKQTALFYCKHPLYLCEPAEENGQPVLACPCGHVIRWDASRRSTMTEIWNGRKAIILAKKLKEARK